MTVRILVGDVREKLAELPDDSVHCVVTSPPYWGLRDYGIEPQVWGGDPGCEHAFDEVPRGAPNNTQGDTGQRNDRGNISEQAMRGRDRGAFCSTCGAWRGSLGLEPGYRFYVEHMVAVFRAVRQALRPDGTLWLNLGDSYATGAGAVGARPGGGDQGDRWAGVQGSRGGSAKQPQTAAAIGPTTQPNRMPQPGLKPKDLVGIPWRVALALQADGWWLRQDIIWAKPNPMPESVTDRCTKAHEYLFLLSKSERYHYDAEAIEEPVSPRTHERRSVKMPDGWDTGTGAGGHGSYHRNGREKGKTRKLAETGSGIKNNNSMDAALATMPEWRNKRSVWTVATAPFPEAHFATFPPTLIEPCILAGCPEGGTVLDPFLGSGTTALVADRLKRNCIGVELNPDYAAMAKRRLESDAGLFADVA